MDICKLPFPKMHPTRHHSFTTLNCPSPPLLRSIPLTGLPIPPACLLVSLRCPLWISALPASRTAWLWASVSGRLSKCLSIPELSVPRSVSPTPCIDHVSTPPDLPDHQKAYMNSHSRRFQVLQRASPLLLWMSWRCSIICLLGSILSLWMWCTNLRRWRRTARVGKVVSTTWTRGVAVFILLAPDVVVGLNGRCLAPLLWRRLWASLADWVLSRDIGPLLLASYFCHFAVVATRADTRIEFVCQITCVWSRCVRCASSAGCSRGCCCRGGGDNLALVVDKSVLALRLLRSVAACKAGR